MGRRRDDNLISPDLEPRNRIQTVSELTADIREILENKFPFIWITGEISNFRRPVSGHCYFTLKDDAAQISSVMFRGQTRNLKFAIENGLRVTGFGRVSVYEPRGTYQLIFEYLEPGGIGALQVAFEQLKSRLASEGLFDASHKRPLPRVPQKISVITSPTGSVIHDILNVVHRRFENLPVEVVPVKVQGAGSVEQIVDAIDSLNHRAGSDVIILARGGGSIEDLHAFNDEMVARAIYRSTLPVVSGVGHETDYTISDFVADLRAPTPSAAAEIVVPVKSELHSDIDNLVATLAYCFSTLTERRKARLRELTGRLRNPVRQVQDFRLRTDDLTERLNRTIHRDIRQRKEFLYLWKNRLNSNNPISYIHEKKEKLHAIYSNFLKYYENIVRMKSQHLGEISGRLQALNPTAVLARGYSITRTLPDASVVTDPGQVHPDQPIEILVKKGAITAKVQ